MQKNLHYILDVDYSTVTNCEASGCDNEGICRCGRIENAEIMLNMRNAEALASEILGVKDENDKRLETVLLTYYIQNHWIDDSFDINICGGYYGEEIESVSFGGKFEKNIDAFLALPLPERIQMAVTPMGVMVHPKLRNITGCSLITVNTKDLVLTNRAAHSKYFSAYIKAYKNWFIPICNPVNGKYEVLDGNHRAKAVQEAKKPTIEAIVIE